MTSLNLRQQKLEQQVNFSPFPQLFKVKNENKKVYSWRWYVCSGGTRDPPTNPYNLFE